LYISGRGGKRETIPSYHKPRKVSPSKGEKKKGKKRALMLLRGTQKKDGMLLSFSWDGGKGRLKKKKKEGEIFPSAGRGGEGGQGMC